MSETRRQPGDSDEDLTRRAWLLRLGRTHGACRRRWSRTGPGGCDDSDRSGRGGAGCRPAFTSLQPSIWFTCWVRATRRSVPPGAETDFAVPRRSPFQPLFFSQHELEVVTRLVGVLLGSVDARALSEAIAWI